MELQVAYITLYYYHYKHDYSFKIKTIIRTNYHFHNIILTFGPHGSKRNLKRILGSPGLVTYFKVSDLSFTTMVIPPRKFDKKDEFTTTYIQYSQNS